MWYAGSDVMGCRRPTGGVFSYVSSDRVTLRAFPVATPRGRSSSSHEGESAFLTQIQKGSKEEQKQEKQENAQNTNRKLSAEYLFFICEKAGLILVLSNVFW